MEAWGSRGWPSPPLPPPLPREGAGSVTAGRSGMVQPDVGSAAGEVGSPAGAGTGAGRRERDRAGWGWGARAEVSGGEGRASGVCVGGRAGVSPPCLVALAFAAAAPVVGTTRFENRLWTSAWMARRQPRSASRQPPDASRQLPATSRPPPATSRQPGTASWAPPATSRQPPAGSRQLRTRRCRPFGSRTGSGPPRRLSAVGHRRPAVGREPLAVSHRPPPWGRP